MTQNNAMNFLPEDYVEKRQATRAAVVFIGLLMIVVGGILGTWFFKQWQASQTFEALDHKRADYEQASKDLAEMQQLQQEKARMMTKAEITTTLMERVRRSDILQELTRLSPRGLSLLSFELKSKEAQQQPGGRPMSDLEKAKLQQSGQPAEVKAPQVEVTLDLIGLAPTDGEVAAYIAALGKSPLLQDVNLLFSEEYKKGPAENAETLRKFRVEMKINPEADLRGLASVK